MEALGNCPVCPLLCISLSKVKEYMLKSTQPCIPPGALNRVPAAAGLRAGMSPLPGGR